MANSDLWRSVQSSLNWAGHDGLAGIAGRNADTADALARAREAERQSQGKFLNDLHQHIKAGQANASHFGIQLPDMFKPLEQIPALFGQFPKHPDGHCMREPYVALQWIADNRQEAMAGWHREFILAVCGLPASQFNLAKALETGADGTTPDAIRAFFFYYYAGKQGHAEARQCAELLADKIGNFGWIIEPPFLIFPGKWEIIQDKFGQAITTLHFVLAENGSLSGQITDFGGVAGDQLKTLAQNPIGKFGLDLLYGTRISGRWSFDRGNRVLHIHSTGHVPGAAPAAPEHWGIEFTGVRLRTDGSPSPVFFGKDQDSFSYYVSGLASTL